MRRFLPPIRPRKEELVFTLIVIRSKLRTRTQCISFPITLSTFSREPKIIYPSGKYIVVKSVVDPSDCFVYRGHSFPTTVAKFSPNGYWVASADSSGKVRVWSWDNPEHLTKLETSVFAGSISDLQWDGESKKIVAVGDGAEMNAKVFTWDTGNSVGEMPGHVKKILSVAYKPTRPFRIMTGGEDFKTVFFAGPPFKVDHYNNNIHSNFINCVRYSPDGSKIISVGSDKKIQMYDGATGQPTEVLSDAHAGSIYSVAFSPDGLQFATSSADKTVKIWNTGSLTLEGIINISADPQISDAQVSLLWATFGLLSVSLNGNINMLEPSSTDGPVSLIQANQSAISSMFIDRVAGVLYTGSIDGVVCSRNLLSPNFECTKLVGTDKKSIYGAGHTGKVVGLIIAGGEIVSAGWDDKLRFASPETKQYHSELALNGQPVGVGISNTDCYVVVTTKEIALFRGQSKVAELSVSSLPYSPTCCDLLGEVEVAVGGSDNKTHVFGINGNTFTEIATIETRSAVTAVAYSPTGDFLAIGDTGRQVEVYERQGWSAKIKGKWVFHTSKINCLSWNPSGTILASGSTDENIFLWKINNPMSKIQLSYAHMGGVTGTGWLDDERLISIGNDHCACTWKIPLEEQV